MKQAFVAFGAAVITVALVVSLGAGAAACSSVPDIHFVDDTASGDAGSDSSDACKTGIAALMPGVCCGETFCARCTAQDCDDCAGLACSGGNVCCRKSNGNGALQCRTVVNCQ